MNTSNEYEWLKKKGFAGFASKYSQECVKSKSDDEISLQTYVVKSKSDDKIDIQVYAKLVQLDLNLGMTASEQLFQLFKYSLRFDLLKVSIHFINIK